MKNNKICIFDLHMQTILRLFLHCYITIDGASKCPINSIWFSWLSCWLLWKERATKNRIDAYRSFRFFIFYKFFTATNWLVCSRKIAPPILYWNIHNKMQRKIRLEQDNKSQFTLTYKSFVWPKSPIKHTTAQTVRIQLIFGCAWMLTFATRW